MLRRGHNKGERQEEVVCVYRKPGSRGIEQRYIVTRYWKVNKGQKGQKEIEKGETCADWLLGGNHICLDKVFSARS